MLQSNSVALVTTSAPKHRMRFASESKRARSPSGSRSDPRWAACSPRRSAGAPCTG
jgi:hypothetical protein